MENLTGDNTLAVVLVAVLMRELFTFLRWLVGQKNGGGQETPLWYLKEVWSSVKHISRVVDRMESRKGRRPPDSEW